MENEKIIKCQIKVNKLLFPKQISMLNSTDNFAIFSANLINNEVGFPPPQLNSYDNFVVKGVVGSLDYQSTYNLTAKPVEDKYGLSYEILYISELVDLSNENSKKIFLQKILPENTFNELYKTLKDPYESIKSENIKELINVKGIGTVTALKLINKFKELIDYSDIYVKLDGYGLTPYMIQKLINKYKNPNLVIEKIKENPYILADEVDGIGFKKADAIALNNGVNKISEYRLTAFINYYLYNLANGEEGHLWVHISSLVNFIMQEIPEISKEQCVKLIKKMIDNKKLYYDKDKKIIGLYRFFKLEDEIAKELIRISNGKIQKINYDWKEIVNKVEKTQGWNFTDEQLQGIKTILENNVTIITGYGGTGKSSTVNAVLHVLKDYSFAQTALSGKAASRLQEVTGQEGYTIHRLLGYKPDGTFNFNKNNPLPYNLILLDESSMVGGKIFLQLLQAIDTNTKLVMLGDIGQLDAIGIGSTFKDMINSNVIKTVHLTKVHRQMAKSGILSNSLKIRDGQQIIAKTYQGEQILGELQDFIIDIYSDLDDTILRIMKYYKEYFCKVKTPLDIQIVVPMKERGKASVKNINTVIQKIYNPSDNIKLEVEVKKKAYNYILREGDKVINKVNNYKTFNVDGDITPIYNGNMGIIEKIEDGVMIINFKGIGKVVLEKKNWKNIMLGYAVTGHAMQGNEVNIVICGLDYSSYKLLNRQWVYTSITRGKKLCVLCSQNKALCYAIDQDYVINKHTFLKDLLIAYSKQSF